MLEERSALQGDLDKLKEWIGRKLMIFNKDKCRLIHLGRNKPLYNNTGCGLTA